MRLALTALILGLCLWASTGPGLAAATPAALRDDCDEACHSWLIEDRTREILADVHSSFSGRTMRVRYGADWLHGQSCPRGRRELARRIVGFKHSSGFLTRLFDQGFCPRATVDETSGDAPYLASPVWNQIVFDAERARLLTRDQYAQWVVPAIKRSLASQDGSRWQTLRLFVNVDIQYADLLTAEISALLSDPAPSARAETGDGDSSKAVNVVRLAEAVTANGDLVDSLLNNMDADPSLATRPGYRRLIGNLAGNLPSVPTPPVCANVDRIARHLSWGDDSSQDAKFLATLSRCDRGSENLLRLSLADPREGIAATAIRVWWAAATNGHAIARNLAPDVVKIVTNDAIPAAGAQRILLSQGPATAPREIKEGSATEDVALGLAKLGLLSETVDRLLALGKADQARALLQGLEQGIHRKL